MKFSLSFQRNEDFMENKDCRFTISIRKAAVFLLHSILLFLQITFCLSHFQDIDFYVLETEISLSFL